MGPLTPIFALHRWKRQWWIVQGPGVEALPSPKAELPAASLGQPSRSQVGAPSRLLCLPAHQHLLPVLGEALLMFASE